MEQLFKDYLSSKCDADGWVSSGSDGRSLQVKQHMKVIDLVPKNILDVINSNPHLLYDQQRKLKDWGRDVIVKSNDSIKSPSKSDEETSTSSKDLSDAKRERFGKAMYNYLVTNMLSFHSVAGHIDALCWKR